jgi:hypothetical protein
VLSHCIPSHPLDSSSVGHLGFWEQSPTFCRANHNRHKSVDGSKLSHPPHSSSLITHHRAVRVAPLQVIRDPSSVIQPLKRGALTWTSSVHLKGLRNQGGPSHTARVLQSLTALLRHLEGSKSQEPTSNKQNRMKALSRICHTAIRYLYGRPVQ